MGCVLIEVKEEAAGRGTRVKDTPHPAASATHACSQRSARANVGNGSDSRRLISHLQLTGFSLQQAFQCRRSGQQAANSARPTIPPMPTPRLPALDLLRAFAILWVMLFHSWIVGGLGPSWEWLSRHGWMGVDLFFALSGYLVGGQVLAALARGTPLRWRDFYARRAWRIVPAYAATLALYLAWPDWREAPGMAPWWTFASFTVNLSIDYPRLSAFSHAWSLCVEEHFYLLLPLLAAALAPRATPGRVLGGLGALVLGGMALRAWLWQRGMATDPDMDARNWFIQDLYYPSWCRLDGLLGGLAVAMLQHFRPVAWAAVRQRAGAVGLLGLALLAGALVLQQERTGLVAVALGWPLTALAMALLVMAAAGPETWWGRHALPGAAPLAAMAFSLYLVHKPAYHLVQLHWGEALQGRGLWAFAAYGAAALAAGALMYLAVERPGLRWRDRRRRADTAAPVAAHP